MKQFNITKTFLEQEYIENNKTFAQIATDLGCAKKTVIYWAKKLGIPSRQTGQRKLEIKGKQFNKLQVIHEIRQENEHLKWLCICTCGEQVITTASNLLKGQKECWNCRNKTIGEKNWDGFGEISGAFWKKILQSASSRNYKVFITIEEAWELFLKQERKCALSSIELKFSRNIKGGRVTASLDRIDSTLDYTIKNIQWVHKDINSMKGSMDETKFIHYCKSIVDTKIKPSIIV